MIGRVESEVERDGKIERETRYYVSSAALSAEMFGRVVRGHWGIENRLHWVLDVVFREDLARLRSGNAPANMAIVRHTALNLLSGARPTTSFKNRRKKAGWNVDYLETVLRRHRMTVQAIRLAPTLQETPLSLPTWRSTCTHSTSARVAPA